MISVTTPIIVAPCVSQIIPITNNASAPKRMVAIDNLYKNLLIPLEIGNDYISVYIIPIIIIMIISYYYTTSRLHNV